MGYNTVMLIRNDAWDIIQKNPEEFIERTAHAIANAGGSVPVANYTNVAEVMTSQHNSVTRCYVSAGNTLTELNVMSPETAELIQTEYGREFLLDCIERTLDDLGALHDAIEALQ